MDMKKLAIRLGIIVTVIGLLTTYGTGLNKVWSMEQALDKNTHHRVKWQFNDTWERLNTLKARCGEDLEKCGKADRTLYRLWTIDFKELANELGIEVEDD
jgi:hypothetical protein